MGQPSHCKETRSSLLAQVRQAEYTGLIGSAYQRPRETDVPCLSALSYPQRSFSHELPEAWQSSPSAEQPHLPVSFNGTTTCILNYLAKG